MKPILSFLLLIFSLCGFSQGSYQCGALPSINLNKKLAHDWSLNAKIESRSLFRSGTFGNSTDFKYDYQFTDLSTIIAKKITPTISLSAGYMVRFLENELIHRITEQLVLTKVYSDISLSHRFTLDQSLTKNSPIRYRIRYRLASQIPLEGQTTDPKEFYLKFNTEILLIHQQYTIDIETRFLPHIGYKLAKAGNLELGVDYRLASFINKNPRHRFFTVINWYANI